MNCQFSDIVVLETAMSWYSSMNGVIEELTPEQIADMTEIGDMLEEIGLLSIDDQIHAIKEAVKEIKDRE